MQDNVLDVQNLTKWFEVRRGLLGGLSRSRYLRAVDGIDFEIRNKEIFGLVGESGCGKTTTGRLVLRLAEATSGKVRFKGADLLSVRASEMKKIRREMQMVYQNPYESMPDRLTVHEIVLEPLNLLNIGHDRAEREEMVSKTLQSVGISSEIYSGRYIHELSGGQRQRVAIARAMVTLPKFLVADEPVSMLDVSIRAGVLNLLLDLRDEYGLSYLFITHDIAVARYMCERIGVMYAGKIMESGPIEAIVGDPLHPYTKALMSATPVPDPDATYTSVAIKGEISMWEIEPSGCRFNRRCPYARDYCIEHEPTARELKPNHYVACHFVD